MAGFLELVPELGTEDAGDDRERDDVESVGVDVVAEEVFMQDDGGADGGEPEEEAEGPDVKGTEV